MFGQNVDQIYDQIFGQVFDHVLLIGKYSVRVHWDGEIQITGLLSRNFPEKIKEIPKEIQDLSL